MLDKREVGEWFKTLQDDICDSLTKLDGKGVFHEDPWERPGGGGGRTRIMSHGKLIEKGGVNFSMVHGNTPENILNALQLPESDFFATGVSIVLHPVSPMVPIIHMNIRYFEMNDGAKWFGGGIDLTPHYIDVDDARYFHQELKKVCDQFHPDYYPQFKTWADNYFYIKHRGETRGIGGIFFDRLSETDDFSMKDRYRFVQAVGKSFIPIYTHIANKHRDEAYGEKEKEWQLIRRGRYVEFNLVYDKGTKFGLDTEGRIESILMSLPELASWKYKYRAEAGSSEAETLALLKKNVDFLAMQGK